MNEQKEFKFICEKCSYNTNVKLSYDRHIKSSLHITGQRKTRSDKKGNIFKCNICEYSSINENNYKTHQLNNHLSKEERKKTFTYYCEKCDFGCFSVSSYELHLETKKHQIKTN
jgi:hypothetical protein